MFVSKKGGKWLAVLALAAVAGGMGGWTSPVWSGEPIAWKPDAVIDSTFSGASLEVVVGQILKHNGMEAIFPAPGLKETVDMQFERNPIQGAFERVVQTYGLDYRVSGKTVTVFKRQLEGSNLFTPKAMDADELESVLKELNLVGGGTGVSIQKTRIGAVLFRGPLDQVSKAITTATQLDLAAGEKQDSVEKRITERLKNEMTAAERDKKLAEAQRMADGSSANIFMEVVALKYARVESATVSFQGQDVMVPGIIDSLKNFVGGVKVKGEAADKAGAKPSVIDVMESASGKIEVSADNRTNSIIIQGTKDQIQKVKDVIVKLDKAVPMIEIEVIIAQGDVTLSRTLGMSYGYAHNTAQTRNELSNTLGVVPSASVGGAGTTQTLLDNTGGVPAVMSNAAGGLGMSFLTLGARGALLASLQALASDGKSQVLSAPRVVTLDNRPASISNQSTYSVPVQSANNGTTGVVTIPSGLTLKIKPAVVQDDKLSPVPLVRMEIDANNTTATPSGLNINTTGQTVQTTVLIPEDATFVLGGLFKDSRTENNAGVPVLKDIPVLGYLFGTDDSKNNKSEIVFLITPKVYKHEDILRANNHWAREYLKSQKYTMDKEQQAIAKNGLSVMKAHLEEEE